MCYFYRSQRRKQKVEDIVGITSKINSLAPPGHYGYDNDENGSDLGVLGAGGSIPTTPKTPAVRRKSFKNKKSQSIASEPTGFNQPEAKQPKERTSLAPKHKAAKMDVARAMGIMGFNSSRWLDASQVLNWIHYVGHRKNRMIEKLIWPNYLFSNLATHRRVRIQNQN